MNKVTIYTTENCPYCRMAKDLLKEKNIAYDEIRVDLDEAKRNEMVERSQRRTVPQIFINNQLVGSYDDLVKLAQSGKLNELLNN